MQKITTIITTILLSLLMLSCEKEKYDKPVIESEQLDSITLHIKYFIEEGKSTKALTINETEISNLNYYIFNEKGELFTYQYQDGVNSSTITTTIYTNQQYYVYTIANAGREIHALTIADLEQKSYSIAALSDMTNSDDAVVMSGKTELTRLTDGYTLNMPLTRAVSKVTVKLDLSMLDPTTTIEVTKVALKNVPNRVMLFQESRALSSADILVEGDSRTGTELTDFNRSGCSFYLYENMQGEHLSGITHQNQKIFPDGDPRADISTYIEITAKYNSSVQYGEKIVYRHYLGSNLNNFDLIRNYQYTTNLVFKGSGINEVSWRIDVNELKDYVTSVSLMPSTHKFTDLGATQQIKASILPATAYNKVLSWSSSNSAIATVDANGVVTAKGDGKCTISATSTDGSDKVGTMAIEVDSKIYVTGVTVAPAKLSLYVGEKSSLTATITPSNATDKRVIWSSSNRAIATVNSNSGEVAALKKGEVTITAKSVDGGFTGSCLVTISDKSFTISPTSKTISIGAEFALSYTALPALASGVVPTFVSSNSAIATVDATGKVTGIANGEVTITATAHGIVQRSMVTVLQPKLELPTHFSLYATEQDKVLFLQLDPNTTLPTCVSSNSGALEVVSVDKSGITIKAKSVGSYTITASINGASATCAVTVLQPQLVLPSTFTIYESEGKVIPFSSVDPFDMVITATSSNESGLSVVSSNNSGVTINALTKGSYTITATAYGLSTSCSVTVKPAISLSPDNIKMAYNKYGNTYTSEDLIIDAASGKRIEWIITTIDGTPSSNISINQNGNITAKQGSSGSYKAKGRIGGKTEWTSNEITITLYEWIAYSEKVVAVLVGYEMGNTKWTMTKSSYLIDPISAQAQEDLANSRDKVYKSSKGSEHFIGDTHLEDNSYYFSGTPDGLKDNLVRDEAKITQIIDEFKIINGNNYYFLLDKSKIDVTIEEPIN